MNLPPLAPAISTPELTVAPPAVDGVHRASEACINNVPALLRTEATYMMTTHMVEELARTLVQEKLREAEAWRKGRKR